MAQAGRQYERLRVDEATVSPPVVPWRPDPEFHSVTQAQHAFVGGFEVICYDLPAYAGSPRIVGFEVFGGRNHLTLLRQGSDFETFTEAQIAAEKALRDVMADVASANPAPGGRRRAGAR